MSREEYKAHMIAMLTSAKVEIPDMDAHCDRAVTAGLQAMWGASDWHFKRAVYTLTPSSTADDYELPSEFEAFITVREHTTVQGRKLQFYEEEEFETLFPKLEAHSAGTPRSFTIYADADTGRHKISFFPRPAGGETIKVAYLRTTVTEPEGIPDLFQSGLEAAIGWKCYPLGHVGRAQAKREFDDEVLRLQVAGKIDKSYMGVFPDGTTDQVISPNKYGVPWL